MNSHKYAIMVIRKLVNGHFFYNSNFWASYIKRTKERDERFNRRSYYWRGQYNTNLEVDMYKRMPYLWDGDEEEDADGPTLKEQLKKIEKTGVEYYECHKCREEKASRNFLKETVSRYYGYQKGPFELIKCDKCDFEDMVEYELRKYCEERILPIVKDREYINGKLREQGLPKECRTFELIEIERQILITKRELKNLKQ